MMQDYDGAAVFDAEGNKIGHVERTYVDSSRTPTYAEVKMGALFAKHRLVPLQNADSQDDGLHLPLSKSIIENSPDVSGLGDGVDADTLSRVDAYYGSGVGATGEADASGADAEGEGDNLPQATTADEDQALSAGDAPAADGQDPTAVRDLGDVLEVPVVEEEIVKRPVVKEVVRVRKTSTTDTQTVEDDLRREDVVRGDGDTADTDGGDSGGGVLDRIKSKISGSTLPGEEAPADPMGGQTYRESGAPVSSAAGTDATDE